MSVRGRASLLAGGKPALWILSGRLRAPTRAKLPRQLVQGHCHAPLEALFLKYYDRREPNT
jgi:hypothetical protein